MVLLHSIPIGSLKSITEGFLMTVKSDKNVLAWILGLVPATVSVLSIVFACGALWQRQITTEHNYADLRMVVQEQGENLNKLTFAVQRLHPEVIIGD